jgi:hypothetical protein
MISTLAANHKGGFRRSLPCPSFQFLRTYYSTSLGNTFALCIFIVHTGGKWAELPLIPGALEILVILIRRAQDGQD